MRLKYISKNILYDISGLFKNILLVCPILLLVFFLFSNEPELGTGIDPGMA